MNELNNINKENAFKVPENYFDNFSKELETRISEENLKKKFGNKNPFAVPENYFTNFSVKKNKQKGKIIRFMKPWLSAAAGIIIIFALWQFLLTGIENNNHASNTDSIYSKSSNLATANQLNINNIDIKYLEPEVNAYIDESDANEIYEYTNDDTSGELTNSDDETVYDYFIDYADDNDINELIAEL